LPLPPAPLDVPVVDEEDAGAGGEAGVEAGQGSTELIPADMRPSESGEATGESAAEGREIERVGQAEADSAGRVALGFALHEELATLVDDGGLTPIEALRAATLKPAQFMGADSLGAVEPGRLADLVLLDLNPLTDIRNTSRIRAVVLNGRHLDRAALDNLLAEATRVIAGKDRSPSVRADPCTARAPRWPVRDIVVHSKAADVRAWRGWRRLKPRSPHQAAGSGHEAKQEWSTVPT
jgi:hypothetical protein